MIDYDPDRARAAVQFLAESPYFYQHTRKLAAAVVKPRAMPFKDAAEPLNELLRIGRQNRQAMDNLVRVAEIKRDDRNEYQRQYMAAKRKRDRKVVLLESLLEGRRLPHDMQVRILQHQYVVWNKERDQFLTGLGATPWAERNAQLREFWARKEAEIDQLIVEARKTGPVVRKRKRVVVAQKPAPTAFGETLAKVIKPR